ncbi:MAG: hypothetical protein IT223_12505 [Crocinitomicaceae bacterium]|nr:hypothetical protein [Crocinitomicaceae bacterium]
MSSAIPISGSNRKRKKQLSREDAGLLRAMKESTGETVSSEDFLKELRDDRKNG